jgi:hypothetical protein
MSASGAAAKPKIIMYGARTAGTPAPLSALGNLFNAKKTTPGKTDERRTDMTGDNPANQDDPKLRWP